MKITLFFLVVGWTLGTYGQEVLPSAQGLVPIPEDVSFLRKLLETAKRFDWTPDSDALKKKSLAQWKKYSARFEGRLNGAFRRANSFDKKRVDKSNPKEKDASVKYLENESWVYKKGKIADVVPTTKENITKCYTRDFSWESSKFWSTNPRAFSSWRPLVWCDVERKWVTVTLAEKEEARRKHLEYLDKEEKDLERLAAKEPTEKALKGIRPRVEANQPKQAISRLFAAFSNTIQLRALEVHRERIKTKPIEKLWREGNTRR